MCVVSRTCLARLAVCLSTGDLIDCTRMGVGGKAIPPYIDKITDIRYGVGSIRLLVLLLFMMMLLVLSTQQRWIDTPLHQGRTLYSIRTGLAPSRCSQPPHHGMCTVLWSSVGGEGCLIHDGFPCSSVDPYMYRVDIMPFLVGNGLSQE